MKIQTIHKMALKFDPRKDWAKEPIFAKSEEDYIAYKIGNLLYKRLTELQMVTMEDGYTDSATLEHVVLFDLHLTSYNAPVLEPISAIPNEEETAPFNFKHVEKYSLAKSFKEQKERELK